MHLCGCCKCCYQHVGRKVVSGKVMLSILFSVGWGVWGGRFSRDPTLATVPRFRAHTLEIPLPGDFLSGAGVGAPFPTVGRYIGPHSGDITRAPKTRPGGCHTIAPMQERGKAPMRMTPQEAGRLGGLKGGKSTSAAKRAAAKRNGFQKTTEPGAPATKPPLTLWCPPRATANRPHLRWCFLSMN